MSDIQEVSVDDLKHLVSERAIQGETMLLNMGPQHPSTHGVLRLLLELDGETVINCIPDIGFLHTGVEKNMEAKTYQKAEVMSDRLDYMNPVGNNLAYSMAVEKLVDLDVPARAQALRVILVELTRIQSHLVWLGTAGLDLAAMSMFLYCFREREYILDIMELCSGQRMMTTYIRPGGLWRDVPVEFEAAVRDILKTFPKRIDQYEALLTRNPLMLDRTLGIGKLTGEECLNFGVTGPMLRASGVDYDIRKVDRYGLYDRFSFRVPLGDHGDCYDRMMVRILEMRETLTILNTALRDIPGGPILDPKSKLRGFKPQAGEAYGRLEAPKGELGFYLISDGSAHPFRYRVRPPSLINLTILEDLCLGHKVADVVAILGSVDIVLGEVDR